jgi:opacity protein-like surface antigen
MASITARRLVSAVFVLSSASAAHGQGSSVPDDRRLGIRAFGQVAYQSFDASKSFDAVLGQSSGALYGGGAQVTWRRLFLEASAARFGRSGERVLSSGGRFYRLGVPMKVRVVPLEFTAGYRHAVWRFAPYLGAGIGSQAYRETSSFAEDAENVDERHTSYHVLGGVEVPVWRRIRTALEGQYRSVPDAIGRGGISRDLGERNLGGASVSFKVIVVGR